MEGPLNELRLVVADVQATIYLLERVGRDPEGGEHCLMCRAPLRVVGEAAHELCGACFETMVEDIAAEEEVAEAEAEVEAEAELEAEAEAEAEPEAEAEAEAEPEAEAEAQH